MQISAAYLKNCRMPPFLRGTYFKLGFLFSLADGNGLLHSYITRKKLVYFGALVTVSIGG